MYNKKCSCCVDIIIFLKFKDKILMKKNMYISLLIFLLLLLTWTLFGYLFEYNINSPKYSVLEQKDGYEIRLYEPYLVAQVEVSGTYRDALNNGFRILADYIFGNNTKQKGLPMTTPVTEKDGEKIAMTSPVSVKENNVLDMTAPVTESLKNNIRIITFVMPFEYTLETLPKPNNPDIKISRQESRKVAVLRFSWNASESRVEKKKQELLSLLERDNFEVKSSPEYAGYNSPFSAPWLKRNEIMIEIK